MDGHADRSTSKLAGNQALDSEPLKPDSTNESWNLKLECCVNARRFLFLIRPEQKSAAGGLTEVARFQGA